MSSNWISSLDALAAGGVIDFDAPAFILDQKPRYMGHPQFERLPLEPDLLPPGVKLKDVPEFDEYKKNDNLVQNPSWKKWLFGGLVASGLVGIGLAIATKGKNIKFADLFTKIKNYDFSKLKNKVKMPKLDSVKNFFTSITDKIKNFKIKK